jgi:uncharacterized membrane protein
MHGMQVLAAETVMTTDFHLLIAMSMGVLGGVLRALVGFVKYFERNQKKRVIDWWYLAFSLIVSAIIGSIAGSLSQGDWRLAVVAGYAGTDFVEGLYKVRFKQGLEI